MSNTMHCKVKNFFGFLADTYLGYFSPDSQENEISVYVRNFGDDKADFKQFQFGYLAIACNNERLRPRIETIRNLYNNADDTKTVVINIRTLTQSIRGYLDRIDSIPEEELKEFITKFSRYMYLFTMMYFNKPKEVLA